jgi:hypothetical protein
MVLPGVTAEQEAVVLQDVLQGHRHRRGGLQGAAHDAGRPRADHQRAGGQAELVEQAGLHQLGEQVRAALGEYPLVAAVGQRGHGGLEVDGGVARHDDVAVPGEFGAAVGWRLGGGDDDRPGVRGSLGDETAARVITAIGGVGDRSARRPRQASRTRAGP